MAAAHRILPAFIVALVALVAVDPGLGSIDESAAPLATEAAGGPLFVGVRLAPGRVEVRTTRIANEGRAPGRFSFSVTTSGRLAGALRLTVSDAAGCVVYRGSLAGADEASIGVLEPGESRAFRLAVDLPSGAHSQAAGLAAGATFAWTAAAV